MSDKILKMPSGIVGANGKPVSASDDKPVAILAPAHWVASALQIPGPSHDVLVHLAVTLQSTLGIGLDGKMIAGVMQGKPVRLAEIGLTVEQAKQLATDLWATIEAIESPTS